MRRRSIRPVTWHYYEVGRSIEGRQKGYAFVYFIVDYIRKAINRNLTGCEQRSPSASSQYSTSHCLFFQLNSPLM